MKILHTTLYTDRAYALLKMFKFNIEHVRYCGQRAHRKLEFAKIVRADDGEVIFNIDDQERYYYSWRRTIWAKAGIQNDAKIRDELAWMLKTMIRDILASMATDLAAKGETVNSAWNRQSTIDISSRFIYMSTSGFTDEEKRDIQNYLTGMTVSDAYCVYDILRNRNKLEEKFGEKQLKSWRGAQFDPARVELEIAKREELAKIDKEQAKAIEDERAKCRKEIDEFSTTRRNECEKAVNLITAEFAEKKKALQDRISAALAMAFMQ